MRRRLTAAAAVCFLAAVVPGSASARNPVPEQVPDRLPLLSEPLRRGAVMTTAAAPKTPSTKAVDGDVSDWVGEPTRLGGTSRYDAGEHVYSDFLFDDHGADDGDDAERLAVLGPVAEAEPRTSRLDQLFQAAGDQFDAPRPVGAPDHYGDTDVPDAADLSEVRWAADGDRLLFLARTTTLTDPTLLQIRVLADTHGDEAFDRVIDLHADGATMHVGEAAAPLAADVAVNPDGWSNALEASLPAGVLARAGELRVAVIAGVRTAEGFVPANVAYRSFEPVAGMYNEQRQALALLAGDVTEFTQTIALADLRGGRTESARPGPGYHERQFLSGENISREQGEHGRLQPYGLFVPTSYHPAKASPLTFWLHYRGGKAHSGGAWTPRLITQLGEEHGNIVVTPRGRGTSTWYVTEAHQDFFEVFTDVHSQMRIDANRRYLSGYSMGGYGTYLFGLLYPDLFAGGYSTSGAVTQGAWTGEGPDDCRSGACFVEANDGDANAQLTYRVLENARHFPIVIHHGSNDELVPITGIQRVGARLAELGYRYDLTMFTGYEHYTQALIDEWADGAAYLNTFTRPKNPRQVTYKVVPALVNAVNTVTADGVVYDFSPDGAYWLDGVTVRDGDPADPAVFGSVDVTSNAIPAPATLPLPRAGAFSPAAHSTPYVRHGLDWLELDEQPSANSFTATLQNVATAELDTARMKLDFDDVVDAAITSDGDARVALSGVPAAVRVFIDDTEHAAGPTGGVLHLDVAAGTTDVRIAPAH